MYEIKHIIPGIMEKNDIYVTVNIQIPMKTSLNTYLNFNIY